MENEVMNDPEETTATEETTEAEQVPADDGTTAVEEGMEAASETVAEVRKNFPGYGGLTKEGLSALGVPALVELFNSASEKKVKVFNKKPAAIDRVWEVYPEWDGLAEHDNTHQSEDTDMATKDKTKKTAAPKAPKATKASKEPKEKKPRASAFPDGATIKLLVDGNPKRKGSSSAKRFDKYVSNMLVTDALAKGVKTADIHWDVEHNFIALR